MPASLLRKIACTLGLFAIIAARTGTAKDEEIPVSMRVGTSPLMVLTGSRILETGRKEPFDGTPSASTHLVMGYDAEKTSYLVLVNPNPWQEVIEIYWSAMEIGSATLVSPANEVSVDETQLTNPQASHSWVWRITLNEKSDATWRLKSADSRVAKWTHRAAPQVLVELDSSLTQLSNSLSQLATLIEVPDEPVNGSFEVLHSSPRSSAIPPNWQASMVPGTQWSSVEKHARMGASALLYESQRLEAKGWLQSPLIEIPDEGRVAASAWLFFESGPSKPKVVASTALVDRDGQIAEWTHVYSPSDLERNDGIWQRIDFPIFSKHSLETKLVSRNAAHDRVRFTLDIEGATTLWLDDFWLNRVFLDEEERRRLRTELYLARRELSQNNPQAAWELVHSEIFRLVTDKAAQLPHSPQDVIQSTMNSNATRKSEPRRAFFDGMRRRVR